MRVSSKVLVDFRIHGLEHGTLITHQRHIVESEHWDCLEKNVMPEREREREGWDGEVQRCLGFEDCM